MSTSRLRFGAHGYSLRMRSDYRMTGAADQDGGLRRAGAVGRAGALGGLAGAVGVAAMTVAEALEQRVDGRPDSFVPARTLLALVGRRPPPGDRPVVWNHLMHWGTGVAVGTLRGVWSVVGIRGPLGSSAHAVVRLVVDQTLENATGVGAPPSRWPVRELIVDVGHKLVYAAVTGLVADRLIRPQLAAVHGEERGRLLAP